MGIIIGYIVVLLVYMVCPTYVKVAVTVVNVFLPDPLPYIDEVLMVAGLFVGDN